MPNDTPWRTELADFLRERRPQLRPVDVGLPPGRRRRTPGLRREEVAELAEMGTDWYAWLEQGRPVNVSTRVLAALAEALRLSPDERRHLFALAGHASDLPAPEASPGVVDPMLQRILDELGQSPAYVKGWRTEILAWNRAATVAFGDFGLLPAAERNWLWLLFTDEAMRRRFVHWEAVAQGVLASYRAASAHFVDCPHHRGLVAQLQAASPEFRRWWPRHDVARVFEGRCEIEHPAAGRLSFDVTTMFVRGSASLVLAIHSAVPESGTAENVAGLVNASSQVPPATPA